MPDTQDDFEVSCAALLAAETPDAVDKVFENHPRLNSAARVELENGHVYVVEQDGTHRHLLPKLNNTHAAILQRHLPKTRR